MDKSYFVGPLKEKSMKHRINIVVLAAGEGKRMKTKWPKPLVPILGKCLIDFPLHAAFTFLEEGKFTGDVTVVLGHGKEEVKSYLDSENKKLFYCIQENQLGTADALRSFFSQGKSPLDNDWTLILCADTPLIGSETLKKMVEKLEESDGVVATFKTPRPKGYGRIVKNGDSLLIVEEKDATDLERQIQEVNSGLYLFKTSFLTRALDKIDNNNAQKEFYLTDVFKHSKNLKSLLFEEESIFLGVNDLNQLSQAEKLLREKKNQKLMESGVRLMDPANTFIDYDVEIGTGVLVYPGTFIMGKTTIAEGSTIEHGSLIKNSHIGKNVTIKSMSYIDDVVIKDDCQIGPFARLRPGTEVGQDSKIGNFVEIKKSILAKGVKVSHLSYVGDANIGNNTNIGCGFITCNYDGKNKHQTTIGEDSFIGSDTQMIAPEIGRAHV